MKTIIFLEVYKNIKKTNGKGVEEVKKELERIYKSETKSLISEATSTILFKELHNIAPVFEQATKINAVGKSIKIPVETVLGKTANWKEEYTAPNVDDIVYKALQIDKQYIQATINLTREIESDSIVDISEMVYKRAVKDIASIIAKDTFTGIGTIKGILNNVDLVNKAVQQKQANLISYEELTALTTSIEPPYWDKAKLYTSLEYYKIIKNLRTTQGEILVKGKLFDDIEIVVCSELDNTEYPILFGNIEKLYCYFTNGTFESETQYNKTANTSKKIIKLAVGGRVVDTKACNLFKKI
ncbi:MAG: phage major capsid protein [Fusobacteriaceae bacterium]